MLADFVKAIAAQATTAALAAVPQPVKDYTDPRKLLLMTAEGRTVEVAKPDPTHKEDLETPDELVEFVNHELKQLDHVAVFVSFDKIVAVHDLEDRIDRSTCVLEPTEPFVLLDKLSKNAPVWHTQKDFVRLLRVTLRGCLSSTALLDWVRQVKFEAGSTGTGTYAPGSAAMSRSVRAEVTGQGAAPEQETLSVPVFKQFRYVGRVVCAVEIDPDAQRFALTPYAGEIDALADATMGMMREHMQKELGEEIRVYLGAP